MTPSPIQLAVLVSGEGTTLQNLVDRVASGNLNARITAVIASRPGIGALRRAGEAKIPNFVVERAGFDSTHEFSRRVFSLCDEAKANLVCLAGWLCLLDIPQTYENRVMNIHPALLPSFGGNGMYGRRVHEAVLAHGCKISGCTVHFVDNTYDNGPIILQQSCPVLDDDTPDTLAHRVGALEHEAYPQAIRFFADGRLKVEGRRVRII
jgi:phosphoribosylglycinamide formyltransferase-1